MSSQRDGLSSVLMSRQVRRISKERLCILLTTIAFTIVWVSLSNTANSNSSSGLLEHSIYRQRRYLSSIVKLLLPCTPGQHPFLGSTRTFVGTVRTANPAAGASLAFGQIFDRSSYMLGTRLGSLDIDRPTNPLVSCKRCNIFPCQKRLGTCRQSLS